jgi:hypothetical protein
MPNCKNCGSEITKDAEFCIQCGASISGMRRSGGLAADGGGLTWNRRVPLITNTLLTQDIVLVFGVAVLVVGGLAALISQQIVVLYIFVAIGAGLVILGLVIMLVLQVVLRGGFDTNFRINNKGVEYEAGKTAKKLDRASTVGSAILGSLTGTGAGLIAVSRESGNLHWKDVRYIKVHQRQRAIVFRSKYLIMPLALFCTPENFGEVVELVKKYAPKNASFH